MSANIGWAMLVVAVAIFIGAMVRDIGWKDGLIVLGKVLGGAAWFLTAWILILWRQP